MEFMLFTCDVSLAKRAEAAGVHRIVVDLERRGKRKRQRGRRLECGSASVSDVARMKRAVAVPVMCRINPLSAKSPAEIDAALGAGADVLMLPMFRRAREVERFLSLVGGRARTSLLFETREAADLAGRLDPAAFDEAYVGLNDLAIDFRVPFAYQPLARGIVDRIRNRFPRKPFGFGGITILEGGEPLPTRSILKEQARLRCTQVILRRAFIRDVRRRDIGSEIENLSKFFRSCLRRPPAAREADRLEIRRVVEGIAA